MRSTPQMTAQPRYGVTDVIVLLIRELKIMLPVFLIIAVIGTLAVLMTKKSYTASASLFAGVGQEYVYQPRVGSQERATPPGAGEVAQAEAAIMGSEEVQRRVVQAMGVESFQDKPPAGASFKKQEDAAVRAVKRGLKISAAPLSPVIGISFKSDDAQHSARVLNAVLDQYLVYRREVFQARGPNAIQTQRQKFEAELADADTAYEAFLSSNNLGDFATARAAVANSYQVVFAEQLSLQAQLNQANQRAATLQAQLNATPAEIALYQDLNISAQDQILQLRTQRENLLTRYQADAAPVRELELQIERLQSYVGTGTAVGPKEVRTGPSPIWTELETQRINAKAERDSLAARLAVVSQQVKDLQERLTRLNELESRNSTLAGNREVLSSFIREFQQRENLERADNELVKAGADNVQVIERARAPSKGKSLKLPLLIGVILLAGLTALATGLLRIFLRRGFVVPSTASRTLQLPVLAVAPLKRA
jgi:uncharacterized protein involved in exopolysaccharide biosynthesis